MKPTQKDLFAPVVPAAKLDERITMLRDLPVLEPARDCMREVFELFDDVDGNFVRDFQTTGFDRRFFELFLFAVFHYDGYAREVKYNAPDFILERAGWRFAVEAVTANPRAGVPKALIPRSQDESFEEGLIRMLQQAAIQRQKINDRESLLRFIDPLQAKMAKQYWKLPQAAEMPFVIAIQDYGQEGSMLLTSDVLQDYLYGITADVVADEKGAARLQFRQLPDYQHNGNAVPSCLFRETSGDLSAVMFVNTATVSKFARMALQRDKGRYPKVSMQRAGWFFPKLEIGKKMEVFHYVVGESPKTESWSQGITVFHNPAAVHPLDPRTLPGMRHIGWTGSGFQSCAPSFHPEASYTSTWLLVSKMDGSEWVGK